jgi:hypothetical protein
MIDSHISTFNPTKLLEFLSKGDQDAGARFGATALLLTLG